MSLLILLAALLSCSWLLVVAPLKLHAHALEEEVSELKKTLELDRKQMAAMVEEHERELKSLKVLSVDLCFYVFTVAKAMLNATRGTTKPKEKSPQKLETKPKSPQKRLNRKNEREVAMFVPKEDRGVFEPGPRNRIAFDFVSAQPGSL